MFFVLAKTIGPLIRPMPMAFIALLLFAVLAGRRPRAAWGVFWAGLAGLYLLSTGPVTDMLLRPLERPYAGRAGPQAADAIVVLTGTLDLPLSSPGRAELVQSADRIVDAVILARRWPKAKLIIAGGSSSMLAAQKGEAPILKRLAMDLGIPEERIATDPGSRNTRENAVESRKLLQAYGLRSFVLVTSASHMRRSMGCFRKVGLEPIPYAVDFKGRLSGRGEPFRLTPSMLIPGPEYLVRSSAAIQEYIGYAAYRLKGYV